jgi:hypothetical protein
MPEQERPSLRVVPGAPEQPSSKNQKKRRKGNKSAVSPALTTTSSAIPDAASAALVDHAPDATSVQDGSVAPELVAEPTTPLEHGSGSAATGTTGPNKKSSVWEMVNRRQKALGKKIVRCNIYTC